MDARRIAGAALPRPGALERWRAEIAAGTRKNDMAHLDDLAAAAANEAAGLELLASGDHHGARHFFDCARLRLLGCYLHPSSDKAKGLLREGAAGQGAEAIRAEPSAPSKPTNPWSGLRPTPDRGWVTR